MYASSKLPAVWSLNPSSTISFADRIHILATMFEFFLKVSMASDFSPSSLTDSGLDLPFMF